MFKKVQKVHCSLRNTNYTNVLIYNVFLCISIYFYVFLCISVFLLFHCYCLLPTASCLLPTANCQLPTFCVTWVIKLFQYISINFNVYRSLFFVRCLKKRCFANHSTWQKELVNCRLWTAYCSLVWVRCKQNFIFIIKSLFFATV